MELVTLFFRLTTRLIGFSLIIGVFGLLFYFFTPLPMQARFVAVAIAIWISWRAYDYLVGNLCGDIAIFVRFLSIKGAGIGKIIGSGVEMVTARRFPMPVAEVMQEITDWKDVEDSQRVRRTLSKGRLTTLLGHYNGSPKFCNLADDIGKLYICAPDRQGKTQMIIEMVASILLGHPLAKKEFDFVFIDITRDLAILRPLGQYVHDMTEAHRILLDLGKEADRRNVLREQCNYAGWWHEIPAEFEVIRNGKTVTEHRPKPTILIIDEAIQVLQRGGPAVKKAWENLIDIGWKNGILMVTTSLYTRGDLIPVEFTALMRGRVVGNMATRQGFINVIEVDYYDKYKEMFEQFVNEKYHFALCVRGGTEGKKDSKPILFSTVQVPKERLMELIQEAVIDPGDWKEALLAIWFNSRGKIGSEELARRTRMWLESHNATGIRPEIIHKKSALETLRQAVDAGIAVHGGEREFYLPSEDTISYGVVTDKWDKWVLDGGLEKRVRTGEEMAKMKVAA